MRILKDQVAHNYELEITSYNSEEGVVELYARDFEDTVLLHIKLDELYAALMLESGKYLSVGPALDNIGDYYQGLLQDFWNSRYPPEEKWVPVDFATLKIGDTVRLNSDFEIKGKTTAKTMVEEMLELRYAVIFFCGTMRVRQDPKDLEVLVKDE